MNWYEFLVRVALGSTFLGIVSYIIGAKIYAGRTISNRSLALVGGVTTASAVGLMTIGFLPIAAAIALIIVIGSFGAWLFLQGPRFQQRLGLWIEQRR
jgi:hypothetical protein